METDANSSERTIPMYGVAGLGEASLILPIAVSLFILAVVLPVSEQNRRIHNLAYLFLFPLVLDLLALFIHEQDIRRSLAVIADFLLLALFIPAYVFGERIQSKAFAFCSVTIITTVALVLVNTIKGLPDYFAANAPLTYAVPLAAVLIMFLFKGSDNDKNRIFQAAMLFAFLYVLDTFSGSIIIMYMIVILRSLAYIILLSYFARQSRRFRRRLQPRHRLH